MYYPFVRKILLQLDLKRTHEFTFQRLRHITGMSLETLARQKVPAKPINYMDLAFKSPLGLAVGPDKDGECIDVLGAMGFGSIEAGIVMSHPQPGNDKSRLFRPVDVGGSINRMGFSSLGVDSLVENVKKIHYDGVLGINIGKNKDTPTEQDKGNYLICMEEIYAYAGYIAINISSPNTPELRTLQYGETLDDLLTAIKNEQNSLQVMHHKHVPAAVKIAPGLSEEELIQVVDSLVRHSIDGVIVTNTTLDRSLVQGMKNCDRIGGLSGCPFQLKSTEIIRCLSQELNERLPIIGAGGINSVVAAREGIAAGASPVQIYSGFIFKGPPLIREIVTHI